MTTVRITEDDVEAMKRPIDDVVAEAHALLKKRVRLDYLLYEYDGEASRKVKTIVSHPIRVTKEGVLSEIDEDDFMKRIDRDHPSNWAAIYLDGEWVTFIDEYTSFQEILDD